MEASRFGLVVVDVQNDFCLGGRLEVPNGNAIIGPLNQVIKFLRKDGKAIFFATRDWHPVGSDHFKKWPVHCVQDTRGAELHRDLQFLGPYVLISKGIGKTDDGYSGFEGRSPYQQSIADICRDVGVKILLVGGLATDYCVRATVLDALGLQQFERVWVLEDAIRAVNPESGQKALDEMRTAGATVRPFNDFFYNVLA